MNTAPSIRARRVGFAAILVALACQACGGGDEAERSASRGSGGGASGAAKAGAAPETKEIEPLVYKDEDFVESTKNRDPFRSYTAAFRAKAPEDIQRRVIMPATAVEEMRLIAIVTGIPRPKAMLLDPMGVGYVVERGDYIGRPKIIQATGSVSMTLNWRVDRIRENEVVITQQDPGDPTRTALTKIIPLREEVAQR